MNSVLLEWIGNNRQIAIETRHWKKLKKIIKQQTGISDISAQEVFDHLYPHGVINCDHARFVSFSVGYRTCRKNCQCYTQRLSQAVKETKSKLTADQKQMITNKRVDTVRTKYGVNNVFQSAHVKEKSSRTKQLKYGDPAYSNPDKRKSTNQAKYGAENPLQNPEVHAKSMSSRDHRDISLKVQSTKAIRYGSAGYNNPELRAATNFERYGHVNPAQSSIIQTRISESLRRKFFRQHQAKYNITALFDVSEYQPGTDQSWICNRCGSGILGHVVNGSFPRCYQCHPSGSNQENQIKEWLKLQGFDIVSNSRSLIAPLELDIFVPARNVAIEYCGLYWHTEQKGKSRQYHKNKLTQAAQRGIRLVTIMSDLWIQRRPVVEARLSAILAINKSKIYARACEVKTIESSAARDFLEKNHLQGWVPTPYNVGLVHDQRLMSVMTFSKTRFDQSGYELVRFASLNGYNVVGAASRLLSHALDQGLVQLPVVTFSDNSWGYTDFYQRLGFEKVSDGVPGYHYVSMDSPDQRLNRLGFQKHKLFNVLEDYDPALTEYQNMVKHGYDRVWDCGHSKYIKWQ